MLCMHIRRDSFMIFIVLASQVNFLCLFKVENVGYLGQKKVEVLCQPFLTASLHQELCTFNLLQDQTDRVCYQLSNTTSNVFLSSKIKKLWTFTFLVCALHKTVHKILKFWRPELVQNMVLTDTSVVLFWIPWAYDHFYA